MDKYFASNLTTLFVGKNKIVHIENLDQLSSLSLLSIQSNRIREISGLDKLINLEELYIADNGLTNLKGLESQNLQTLEIANNKVSDLSGKIVENNVKVIQNNIFIYFTGLSHMSNLEEFWANSNDISKWPEVLYLLLTNLCIYATTQY